MAESTTLARLKGEMRPVSAAAPGGVKRAPRAGMGNGRLGELTVTAARETIALVERLPRRMAFFKIGGQLFDSGTSQAANYRAARRARSTKDFIAKLKIVEEESDESDFWIDRLFDAKLPTALQVDARALQGRFVEITRMTVASIKTVRNQLRAANHK